MWIYLWLLLDWCGFHAEPLTQKSLRSSKNILLKKRRGLLEFFGVSRFINRELYRTPTILVSHK